MEMVDTWYPQEQYKEYNDLGTYFAYMKHELMVNMWSSNGSNLLALPNINESIRYKLDIRGLAEITRLDGIIHGVAQGQSLALLYENINQIGVCYEELFKTEFWVSWTNYIKKLLDLLMITPQAIQNEHVRSDIHYVYSEQYTRLTQRVGVKEFAEIIGWSQRKLTAFRSNGNPMPNPVESLGATPLWTIGQAENFLRVIEAREKLKIRGDWASMQEQYHSWKLDWQTVKIDCENPEDDENERIHFIKDSATSYSYSSNSLQSLDTLEDLESAAHFYTERLHYCPETYYSIGTEFLRRGELDKAEEYLVRAKEQFESVIPTDLEGLVADHEEQYYFTYLFMSFLEAEQGNIAQALNTLRYIQSRVDIEAGWEINFSEELEILENNPKIYTTWIRERYTYYFQDQNVGPQQQFLGEVVEEPVLNKDLIMKYYKEHIESNRIVYFFNGWTRSEIFSTSMFIQDEVLFFDTLDELPIYGLEVRTAKFNDQKILVVTDPKRPKNIYLFGLTVDEAKQLVNVQTIK